MRQNPQTAGRLRPVDLARRHGLSTQAVRNYEAAGILPSAGRTAHGYRTYTPLHAAALGTFLALVPGHGHATATAIMRAVNRDDPAEALRLVDESHVQLLEDRRTLDAVERALHDLGPGAVPVSDDRGGPRRDVRRTAGGKAGHPARHAAEVGARWDRDPAPRPEDGIPGVRPGRRAGRRHGAPAPAGAATAWSRSHR